MAGSNTAAGRSAAGRHGGKELLLDDEIIPAVFGPGCLTTGGEERPFLAVALSPQARRVDANLD
ncbi:MAG TPA: hypothetical protein VLR45_00370, partial [Desulfoprunum sp.]|nr:hypothetical protein [Desulfoprunum sp.]